jgi:hypothetical protein
VDWIKVPGKNKTQPSFLVKTIMKQGKPYNKTPVEHIRTYLILSILSDSFNYITSAIYEYSATRISWSPEREESGLPSTVSCPVAIDLSLARFE